jgi:hypothetical protein
MGRNKHSRKEKVRDVEKGIFQTDVHPYAPDMRP